MTRPTLDPVARDALVLGHLRLCAYAVRRRTRGRLDPDLYQDAVVALLMAADRYDPGWGVKFLTYAWPRVLGAVQRAGDRRLSVLHVPDYLAEAVRYDPDGPRREFVTAALSTLAMTRAPSAYLGLLADRTDGLGPDDLLDLRRAVDALPEPEATVIRLRHGVGGSEVPGLTKTAVGRRLGMPWWRVEDVERRALATLRARLGA